MATVTVSGRKTAMDVNVINQAEPATGLATSALQSTGNSTLASILTELQTLNAALVTANGHLAAIETNTAPAE